MKHEPELRDLLTRLRDGKVGIEMAVSLVKMIVAANHSLPPARESGHVPEGVKAEHLHISAVR